MREAARIAYDAYIQFCRGRDTEAVPYMQWDALPERIREAWRAAIAAVFDEHAAKDAG